MAVVLVRCRDLAVKVLQTVRARDPDLRGSYPLAGRAASLASYKRVAADTPQKRLGAIFGQQAWESGYAAVELLGADVG